MTEPKENEEINEELSTNELKSVSGGFGRHPNGKEGGRDETESLRDFEIEWKNGHGTGSGMTQADYKKSILSKNIRPCIHET